MKELTDKCPTCLTSGRRLISMSKIKSALREIKFEQVEYIERICWECHRMIVKFYDFMKQVEEAQTELMKKVPIQKTLSKLICTTKNSYDDEITHNYDPLTHSEFTDKSVTKSIKQEDHFDLSDYDSDQKLQVYVDNMKKTKTKRLSKTVKIKIKEDNHSELKDKFDTVLYTEEEMIRSREEKRNQPNYKKIPFKCDSCVLGFTRKDYFNLHMEKKHNETIGRHKCTVCSTIFATPASLSRHINKHYMHFKCVLCDYKTSAVKAALNHCRDKHEMDCRNRIHCKQCGFIVRTPEELTEHNKKEHILYCNECGEKFKGKNTLRTHLVRIHAVKREFICDVCKKTFLTKSRLESHMIKHSQILARRLAYCNVCCIQYKDIHVYRNHLRNSVNHAQKRYPCPVCDKKFASKVYWTKHYNFYHLKKSQYKCESCNKLFISDWRLKNHRQKHHGLSRSRDHGCYICHKKFYTSSTLRAHMLTHSERRQYMCEGCGDTFKQRPALYTHARLVHKT